MFRVACCLLCVGVCCCVLLIVSFFYECCLSVVVVGCGLRFCVLFVIHGVSVFVVVRCVLCDANCC